MERRQFLGGPSQKLRGTEFVALEVLTDFLSVVLGLVAIYWLRFVVEVVPLQGGWDTQLYLNQLPWAVVFWMISLHLTGNYRNQPLVITFNRARRLVLASGLALMLIIVRNYFFRIPDLSRVLFPLAFVSVLVALVTGRVLLQQFINAYLVGSRLPRSRVLIVGTNPVAYKIAARVKKFPAYAQELAGFLTTKPEKVGRVIAGVPVLGTVTDLRKVLRENSIQDVYVTQGDLEEEQIFPLFLEGEMERARVHVVASLEQMMRSTIYYDEQLELPVYRVRESPLQGANLVIKRLVDLVLSSVLLLIFSPLLVLIAVGVKWSSPGPIFFRQRRAGLYGQAFEMIKFRTMRQEAESAGPVWGDRQDPRATAFGTFLRRTSLDELPQLWNVLKGDMSIVGPRPEQLPFVEQFKETIPHYMRRHQVKAGMTGWAQVHGLRGQTSLAQRLRYDLYYIENWSLWLDLKILLMTLPGPRRRRLRVLSAPVDRYLTPRTASGTQPQPAPELPHPPTNPS
ncbi:MAG: undecaprenyl-phosphate glucose phosphotransferase [Candidatus Sumerlaeia bacterium]|nr:undecaprenyl-phosphate glucose phosphotransferase [Candidatus Sumerlaeia bacterium]